MSDVSKKVIDSYKDGRCPDCCLEINYSVQEGEACVNCGHVFYSQDAPLETVKDYGQCLVCKVDTPTNMNPGDTCSNCGEPYPMEDPRESFKKLTEVDRVLSLNRIKVIDYPERIPGARSLTKEEIKRADEMFKDFTELAKKHKVTIILPSSPFEGDYCTKCGCHFVTHNDDGSCVDEWAKHRNPIGPGYTEDV